MESLRFSDKALCYGENVTDVDAAMQVLETPKLYARVVKPYIDSIPSSRIQWVYNILEKKVSCHLIKRRHASMLLTPRHVLDWWPESSEHPTCSCTVAGIAKSWSKDISLALACQLVLV